MIARPAFIRHAAEIAQRRSEALCAIPGRLARHLQTGRGVDRDDPQMSHFRDLKYNLSRSSNDDWCT
jgi:hypothetical protein